MQKKPPSSLCAGAAIAAALALGSTVALAQDITADVPTVAPPAPTAVPPTPVQAPVMTQTPVVQAVPAVSPVEAVPAASSRSRAVSKTRQAAPRAAARAPAASSAVAVPAAVTPPRVPAGVAAPSGAAVPSAEPAAVAAVQPAEDGLTGAEAGLFGLLAVAGLGGAALIVARSRRRPTADAATIEVTPRIEAAPAAPAAPVTVSERSAASPERFAMPAGPVPTGLDRDELLRRMVAAPPDEANPFVSRKRRAHRARMLLAERERELRDHSTEPFDWRTYRPTGANAAPRADVPETVPDPT